MAVDILLSAQDFSNRESTRMNAKNEKSKSNRRSTQIDADKFLENRLCDRTTLHLRAFAFICGSSFIRVHSPFFWFLFIHVYSRSVFEFGCGGLL
jgi:hypothetical protein